MTAERATPIERDWWVTAGDRAVLVVVLTEYDNPGVPFDWTDAVVHARYSQGGLTDPWDGAGAHPDPPVTDTPSPGRLTVTLEPVHTEDLDGRIVLYEWAVARTSDDTSITVMAGRIVVRARFA